nr:baseplate J/gp47 family protein [Kineococcus aurantiacus]
MGRLRFGRTDDGLPPGGRPPDPGHRFDVTFRTGNGVVGNVGAGAIRTLLDDGSASATLRAELGRCRVENPLPAVGGTEPETIEEVRQRAPFAVRVQERAVTATDYADRAATYRLGGHPAVQRATATVRWTGSWHAVVVAVDPAGGTVPDDAFLAGVAEHLDVVRMAGHEVRVVAAQYAALEVSLALHVDPEHRRDLVSAAVLALVSARRLPDGRLGLFHPDRLTFGTSVYLGPLLAAVQAVPGVARVEATRFSRYRQPGTDARAAGRIEIGPYEIARLDDDPNHPERGRFVLEEPVGGR